MVKYDIAALSVEQILEHQFLIQTNAVLCSE